MKKVLRIAVVVMALMGLSACGGGASDDAPITSAWKCVQVTVKGETRTNLGEAAPKFSTTDGTNFVFTLDGKDHNGTLSQEGDKYTFNYDDTASKMEATIKGSTMTVVVVGGTSEFIFEAE